MKFRDEKVPLVVILLSFFIYFGAVSSAVTSGATDNNVNKNQVTSNVLQILPQDAMNRDENKDKDLKTDATITHTSDPAPEFYRGVSASDSLRDRAYDGQRYGSNTGTTGNWLSLDRDSLYRNPYIANAVNKLTGGATATPSVSSLMSPNASYRDRLDYYNNPSSNDYMNSKYGSSNYGGNYGSPYGAPQALDYTAGYGGSTTGHDSIYSNRPSYGYNSVLGDSGGFGGGSFGGGYGGNSYGGNSYGSNGYGSNGYGHRPHYGGDSGNIFDSKFGKSALLPLAGAALLGVAATLVANPLLLNFAGVGKRRRRRSISNANLKRKYEGRDLPYRGYRI